MRAGLLAALAGSGLPFCGPAVHVAEITGAFPLLWLPAFLCAAAYGAWRRWHSPWLLASLAGALFHGAGIAALYLPERRPPPPGGQPLRVAFSNVLAGPVSRQLLNWLEQEDPDVVGFAEVGPHYEAALAPLQERLPYALHHYVPGNFGIAVYSRYPLLQPEVLFLAPEIATLSAQLHTPARRLRLIVTHPPPPQSQGGGHRAQFERLGALAAAETDLLMLGDFNSTPWSPRLRALCRESGLRHGRQGRGPMPTWAPKRFPLGLLPIDHVLVKGALAITDFRRGPRNRSDHWPILAELSLAAEAP